METYFLNLESSDVPIDRPKINAQISRQLAKYCPLKNDIIEPLNVQHRLGEFELFDKYIYCKAYENLVEQSFTKATTNVSPIPTTEELEVLVSPQDMIYMNNSGNVHGNSQITSTKSQVSLLKPKSERTSMGRYALQNAHMPPEPPPSKPVPPLVVHTSKPSAAINNSRMNLLQALKKAKDQKLANQMVPVVQTQLRPPAEKSKLTPAIIKTEPMPIKASSSVISSSVSSGSDDIELPEEDVEPVILGKEAFLRVVGLCTQTYKEYIMSRRSERKRRNVTSTERGDFHYGKLELFEVIVSFSFFTGVYTWNTFIYYKHFMYVYSGSQLRTVSAKCFYLRRLRKLREKPTTR